MGEIGAEARRRVAGALKDYLARERISREQFAFRTKLGKSTIDKLLTGLFSEKTLAVVESQTGLSLRSLLGPEGGRSIGEEERVADLKPMDVPSIAVLPFANLGVDASREFLADGLTEDIITALARLRWLFVIARNSTFVYKGK